MKAFVCGSVCVCLSEEVDSKQYSNKHNGMPYTLY